MTLIVFENVWPRVGDTHVHEIQCGPVAAAEAAAGARRLGLAALSKKAGPLSPGLGPIALFRPRRYLFDRGHDTKNELRHARKAPLIHSGIFRACGTARLRISRDLGSQEEGLGLRLEPRH